MKKMKEKGFTIVEMIVYMGLLSILIIVFTDIFSAVLDTQVQSESNSQVVQDGRYLYTRITYDINRATSVSMPASLGSTSASLQAVINGTTYTYALNGGNITLSNGTTTDVLNGYDTSISSLQFQRIGNASGKHTFKISFTVTGNAHVHGPVEVKQFQTTAGLR